MPLPITPSFVEAANYEKLIEMKAAQPKDLRSGFGPREKTMLRMNYQTTIVSTVICWLALQTSEVCAGLTELKCSNVGIHCHYWIKMQLSDDGDVLMWPANVSGTYIWSRGGGESVFDWTFEMTANGHYHFAYDEESKELRRHDIRNGGYSVIELDPPVGTSILWAGAMGTSDGSMALVGMDLRDESAPPWRRGQTFLWSEADGMTPVVDLPYQMSRTRVSDQLDVVVGTAIRDFFGEQLGFAYWTSASGWHEPSFFSDEKHYTLVHELARDGSIAYGIATPCADRSDSDPGEGELFYWTVADGMVGLGLDAEITGITTDGEVVVGTVFVEGQYDGIDELGLTPLEKSRFRLSRDWQTPAIYWSRETGQHDVGNGKLWDISDAGDVAVGGTADSDGNASAIVYDPRSGTRSLQNLLLTEYGLDRELEGWTLEDARVISANGLTIAGVGTSANADDTFWLVDLDYPIHWIYPGNFVRDADLDSDDINELASAIAQGSTDGRFDLNGDQTSDVADVQFWLSDIFGTWTGDVDLDGQFGSADLVNVFQAGKYETGDAALWTEGDWNADGVFSTRDLVLAFQDGGYEQGPRARVTAVPEPTSGVIAVAGLLGLFVGRRWQAR
jgi:hypothetical protein